MSDTVGFVSKLPHDLVEAFRSTLEEVTLSDLIVHVADASSPELDEQIEAVRRVLEEIGAANMPEVLALNKIDLRAGVASERAWRRRYPGLRVAVSAITGEGVEGLLEAIGAAVPDSARRGASVLIPWDRGDLVAMLYRDAEVLKAEAEPDGTRVHARVGLRELAAVRGASPTGVRRRRARRARIRRRGADRPERRVVPAPEITVSGFCPRSAANRERQELQPHRQRDLREDAAAAADGSSAGSPRCPRTAAAATPRRPGRRRRAS